MYKTHKMYQIPTHTSFNETESSIQSKAHFVVKSRIDDFSVNRRLRLDAQTLVLLLLELISPHLPHPQLLLGWQRLISSENRLRWMGKRGINSRLINTVHLHCRISQLHLMSSRSDTSYPLVLVSCAPTLASTSSLNSKVPYWFGVMGTRGKWLSKSSCLRDSDRDQAASGTSRELIVRFSSRTFELKTTELWPKSKNHVFLCWRL